MKRITRKPLSHKVLTQIYKAGKKVSCVIPADFDSLIEHNIESLNDCAEHAIIGDKTSYALSDIAYRAVGVEDETLLIQVTASLDSTKDQGSWSD
jgi:hypothetical protein